MCIAKTEAKTTVKSATIKFRLLTSGEVHIMVKAHHYETNLRELIEENGYTFKEISEETGISLSSLFIYARGERSIPHENRYKIARAIGCSVTDIVSKKPPQHGERKS